MAPAWTIRRTLVWMSEDFESRGISTPRLDAELLISRALDCDRIGLYMDMERPLAAPELGRIRALVERRRRREPVAYILGEREFYGRRFLVDPSVLIPRPDTETLIDRILEHVPSESGCRILELGTGSGAVAVTIAAERTASHVRATDVSASALAVAGKNAKLHGVDNRLEFNCGDLFDTLETGEPYDIVCFNPPYIARSDFESLAPEIVRFEPRSALVGGEDGLDYYRRTLASVEDWLDSAGNLFLEVGQGQAEPVVELIEANGGFREVETYCDLGGVQRVIRACIGGPR